MLKKVLFSIIFLASTGLLASEKSGLNQEFEDNTYQDFFKNSVSLFDVVETAKEKRLLSLPSGEKFQVVLDQEKIQTNYAGLSIVNSKTIYFIPKLNITDQGDNSYNFNRFFYDHEKFRKNGSDIPTKVYLLEYWTNGDPYVGGNFKSNLPKGHEKYWNEVQTGYCFVPEKTIIFMLKKISQ